MPPVATPIARASSAETWSPELVLVDRALAARARERLADPGDTLSRLERDLAFRRLPGRAEQVSGLDEVGSAVPQAAARHRKTKLTVAGAIAASLMASVLTGVNVDLRGTPAGAESTALDLPSATPAAEAPPTTSSRTMATQAAPESRRARGTPSRAGDRTPRRFAWAPAPGASGYRVELFRADRLVYSSETTAPQLDLPSEWMLRGRRESLVPGSYRWYVWPIRSGQRQAQATVQASLVVR